MGSHLLIVGFGDVVEYKYLRCRDTAIKDGLIDGYSLLELRKNRLAVEKRLNKSKLKPNEVFYISEPKNQDKYAERRIFSPIFKKLQEKHEDLKVFIITEVKAHEEYLRFCVENGIDSLTEKPIFAPMKNGSFNPESFNSTMAEIIELAESKKANHSVMTLGRYHEVFNKGMLDVIKEKSTELNAPITSFHLSTNSGVWNLYKEYEERDDHPYKQGYGMLMHGAYHYVDLMAQYLAINKQIFPKEKFELCLSSFAGHPNDQFVRIPKKFSKKLSDNEPQWAHDDYKKSGYGETDIVSVFRLRFKKTRKTLTLGTISLEQTTPSVRSWGKIPEDFYNKNGRVSCTTIEAQLSTIFSIHCRAYKLPIVRNGQIKKVDNVAEVLTRSNAAILKDEQYNTSKKYNDYFNSDSNRKLLRYWLEGNETNSTIQNHRDTVKITEALALSIYNQGVQIRIDY